MTDKKGFTLIEILVALIVLGTLAAVALPTYMKWTISAQLTVAEHHSLMVMYNAQRSYYFKHGSYCTTNCYDLPSINANLGLEISDNNFHFDCSQFGSATTFKCIGSYIPKPALTIAISSAPLVPYGGVGCTASPWTACNPYCWDPTPNPYC